MFVALALLLGVLAAPDDAVVPATPYDTVVELTIATDDPELIQGRGPTATAAHEVAFTGTLHVWARAARPEVDLVLEVDEAVSGMPWTSDDDSGGGTTPFVQLSVSAGHRLAVRVAGRPGDTGPVALHFVAMPETDVTSAAAAALQQALVEARQLGGQGDRAGAAAILSRTLDAVRSAPGALQSGAVCAVLRELASSAYGLGAVDAALGGWSAVRASSERVFPEDHEFLAEARSNLAIGLGLVDDLEGARALEEAAIGALEKSRPADDRSLLRFRSSLGTTLFRLGELAEARLVFESVLAAYERILPEDHEELTGARLAMSNCMEAMGDDVGARALREDVVASCERTMHPDDPNLAHARASLANSLMMTGDAAGALRLHEQALATHERTLPAGHVQITGAQLNLGLAKFANADFAGAAELLQKALTATDATHPAGHPFRLQIRENLAVALSNLGDEAAARPHHEAVLAARERTLPEGHELLLLARSNLATTAFSLGDREAALSLVSRLVAGMREGVLDAVSLAPREAVQMVAGLDARLGEILQMTAGASDRSQERAVFELVETMRLVSGEAARSLTRFQQDEELAPLLEQAGAVRRALNDLVAGAAATGDVSGELTRLSLERDRLEREAARRLAERGVTVRPVTVDDLAAVLGPTDVAIGYRRIVDEAVDDGSPYVTWDRVVAHVLTSDGALMRVDLGPSDELSTLANEWRSAIGKPLVARSVERASPSPSAAAGPGAPAPVKTRGKRGVVALEDAMGGRHDDADLDREIESGRRLRERILDPLLAVVGDHVERIFVCADDVLFLMPLDALPAPGDEPSARVGDRWTLVNEVSFAPLLAAAPRAERGDHAERKFFALGGVDYEAQSGAPDEVPDRAASSVSPGAAAASRGSDGIPNFAAIPESGVEAERVAALFERTFDVEPLLLTGGAATKDELFAAGDGAHFVHIATHGWFAPDGADASPGARSAGASSPRMGAGERARNLAPMTLCGLALAGANRGLDAAGRASGVLTAEELCLLDLSRCELAVLSACETNVGVRRAGQGIASLQAALHAAGARTSITSLWQVDDAATRRLFEVFYTNLWTEGMGAAAALWQAKRTLRDEGHPVRHWAGWVLTGDPD